jgi:multiple sugar transport system permease protein
MLAYARQRLRESDKTAYLFIAPYFVLLLLFTGYPILFAFQLMFVKYNTINGEMRPVGLANVTAMAGDTVLKQALVNTSKYVLIYVLGLLIVGLAAALLLNLPLRGRGFFRTLYFFPMATSAVAIAVVWSWLLSQDYGIINYLLGFVGIAKQGFLLSPTQALPSVAVVAIWSAVGYFILIYLAGLQAIPPDLYEAAAIDGAGAWSRFWAITIPLLNPTFVVVIIVSTIWGLQLFAEPWILTGGGPGVASISVALHLYKTAFQYNDMGYAATVGLFFGLLILVVILLERRLIERKIDF